MKHVIYYFTGTGNSLVAARKVGEYIGDCKLIPVTLAQKEKTLPEVETIGIFFPVYAFRPPKLVVKFMKFIRKSKPKAYIYAVATCGGGPGSVIPNVQRLLGKTNLKLGVTLIMPFNFLPFGDVPDPMRQSRMLESAEKKMKEIGEKVLKREREIEPISSFFNSYISPGIMYGLIYPLMPVMDLGFSADKSCKGCGVCQSICPVKNIKMKDGRPKWSHSCQQCWGCLHWCQQKAIQYSVITKAKKRYQHPEVSLQDLRSQQR